jgi:hypothetical protein
MHFFLATILAVVPLAVSAANTTHTTIQLKRHTEVYRRDGTVDVEALKREIDNSIQRVISPFNPCEYPLTCDIVRPFANSLTMNPTPVNAIPCPAISAISSENRIR